MPAKNVEVWKAVPSFEGRYEVSDQGQVRRLFSHLGEGPRILRGAVGASGYRHVKLYERGVRKFFNVHALVAMAFLGPRPERWEVNHKDGIKLHCALTNLEYVTVSGNKHHAYALGLLKNGEGHGRAKLTNAMVAEIRTLYGTIRTTALAERFGVSTVRIYQIARGNDRMPSVVA